MFFFDTCNAVAAREDRNPIKADLVRGQENWQEWNFTQLLEALRKWKDIHPVEDRETPQDKSQYQKLTVISVPQLQTERRS